MYNKKKMIVKEVYINNEGKEVKKWHNIGILMSDENNKQFGTINIFGNKIKFSVVEFDNFNKENNNNFDKKENIDINKEIYGDKKEYKNEIIDKEDLPF